MDRAFPRPITAPSYHQTQLHDPISCYGNSVQRSNTSSCLVVGLSLIVDQVITVRLRTGRSRLRHHMFTEFRIGESSACHCGTSPTTVEDFLQDCQNHQNLRADTWPADRSVREKTYRPAENLQWRISEPPEFLSERTTTTTKRSDSGSGVFTQVCTQAPIRYQALSYESVS